MDGWEMQDWKMRHHIAWVEYAGRVGWLYMLVCPAYSTRAF